jgi:hypothetical protein
VKQLRQRLTYANVMSTIAVFLILGGASAFAATQLAKNSVGSKQLKKNAVTTAKIKKNAVTGAKAKESTFGQVPKAAHAVSADKATSADKAIGADSAGNATGLVGPLAAGQTLRGTFEVAGTKDGGLDFVGGFDISFPIPLATTPTTNVIGPGGPSTAQCPGSFANPTAASGQLCLYINTLTGATGLTELTGSDFPTRFGTAFFPTMPGTGNYQVNGTWAVTG